MNRSIDLEIESIAAGGDGVGRADGLVVFVPRSAPGDVGRVHIEKAGRFARARWEAIRTPGSSRIEPPCAHYVADRCGGCQLQHVDYAAQLEAKSDIIRDSLQRIGKRTIGRPTVRPSPSQWRYRRKLTLALRRRTVGDAWIAGLHPYDNPRRVFDLRDCPITDERVLAVWGEIRRASQLLPPETELRGAVRLASHDSSNGASFLVEGGTHWTRHQEFFGAVPSLGSLWWQPDGQGKRQVASRPGSDREGSFVQVNAAVAAELHAHVVSLALSRRPRTLVDAYAGAGDTATRLAASGVAVTAIELDRDGAALGAARLASPSRMIQARVEDVLADLLPTDVVLLNPPRLGLHERVPEILSAAPPPAVIYVSCNPATLARDIARLPGYRIASVTAFDMFPQTAHVETVCELVPGSE